MVRGGIARSPNGRHSLLTCGGLMRAAKLGLLICAMMGSSAGWPLAQDRFDIGLLIGPTFATDETPVLEFGQGTTYQLTFGWRVWRTGATAVVFEIPFIASP